MHWVHKQAEIQVLSATYAKVSYIDLRAVFKSELRSKPISSYMARGAPGVARDALAFRTPKQIDEASRTRGLYYTLDGVHLNHLGAEMVAGIFAKAIQGF